MEKKIGQYILKQLIGSGTSGEVYKGYSVKEDKRKVVIKMIPKKDLTKRNLDRMKEELIKALDHPNIVKLLDTCTTENHYYVITEYCNGGNLSAFMKRKGGVIDEGTVKFILRQIVKGLDELHAKKVICKDLKLTDIFLSYSNEEAKLEDKPIVKLIHEFKFTKQVPEEEDDSIKDLPIAYASSNTAPELFYRKDPSFKSHIWSLGTMVYELLCGQSCFSGFNRKQLKLNIEKGTYEIPKQLGLSTECLNFLNACIQIEVLNRIGWEDLVEHEFICSENKTAFSPGLFRKVNKIERAKFEVNDRFIFSNKIRHIFPTPDESVKEESKGLDSEFEEEYIEVDGPLDSPKKVRTVERIESNGFIVLTRVPNIEA